MKAIPFLERDAWVNAALGLTEILADDHAALPKGGVPYLPASVDAIVKFVECAAIGRDDLVVDVGSGMGRVCALIHLLTGARCIGIESQPALIARAPRLEGVTYVEGDALQLTPDATHYFLYCPFEAANVERWLDALPRKRPAWLGCVDFPLPKRDWLEEVTPAPSAELQLFRAR